VFHFLLEGHPEEVTTSLLEFLILAEARQEGDFLLALNLAGADWFDCLAQNQVRCPCRTQVTRPLGFSQHGNDVALLREHCHTHRHLIQTSALAAPYPQDAQEIHAPTTEAKLTDEKANEWIHERIKPNATTRPGLVVEGCHG